MSISDNAVIDLEIGTPDAQVAALLTDSGDHKNFSFGYSPLSKQPGFAPVIMAAGVKSMATPVGTAVDDQVSCPETVAVLPGGTAADANTGLMTVAASLETITRATGSNVLISSVTLKDDGTRVVVAGTEGSAFVATRDAAGGPPLIPADSIECFQVRLTGSTAAPVVASEISVVPGLTQENFDRPLYTIDYFDGELDFSAPLPLIHTGGTIKRVWASGATPQFVEILKSSGYTPSETSYTANSTQIYGSTIGGRTANLNAGGFTAYLEDGHTDNLISAKGQERWVKFRQDRLLAPHQLTLATISIARSYPADNQVQAAVSLLSEAESRDYAS